MGCDLATPFVFLQLSLRGRMCWVCEMNLLGELEQTEDRQCFILNKLKTADTEINAVIPKSFPVQQP